MATLYPVIQRVEGLRELEGSLKILRERFGVKTGGVIIRGLLEGSLLIRDEARGRVRNIPSGFTPSRLKRGNRKGAKGIKATPENQANLLRSNIVAHAIPTDSRLAGGRPTVLVRVRNRGYTRGGGGRLYWNQPGSSPGWWWWLEFGTSRTKAAPFMRPAFEANKLLALELFRKTVRTEIEALFKKNLYSWQKAK